MEKKNRHAIEKHGDTLEKKTEIQNVHLITRTEIHLITRTDIHLQKKNNNRDTIENISYFEIPMN